MNCTNVNGLIDKGLMMEPYGRHTPVKNNLLLREHVYVNRSIVSLTDTPFLNNPLTCCGLCLSLLNAVIYHMILYDLGYQMILKDQGIPQGPIFLRSIVLKCKHCHEIQMLS